MGDAFSIWTSSSAASPWTSVLDTAFGSTINPGWLVILLCELMILCPTAHLMGPKLNWNILADHSMRKDCQFLTTHPPGDTYPKTPQRPSRLSESSSSQKFCRSWRGQLGGVPDRLALVVLKLIFTMSVRIPSHLSAFGLENVLPNPLLLHRFLVRQQALRVSSGPSPLDPSIRHPRVEISGNPRGRLAELWCECWR